MEPRRAGSTFGILGDGWTAFRSIKTTYRSDCLRLRGYGSGRHEIHGAAFGVVAMLRSGWRHLAMALSRAMPACARPTRNNRCAKRGSRRATMAVSDACRRATPRQGGVVEGAAVLLERCEACLEAAARMRATDLGAVAMPSTYLNWSKLIGNEPLNYRRASPSAH